MRSYCSIEVDTPQEATDLSRNGNVVPMPMFSCAWWKQQRPDQWKDRLPEVTPPCLAQIAELPPGAPIVIGLPALGQWETNDGYIAKWGEGNVPPIDWSKPLDVSVPVAQLMHLRYALLSSQVDFARVELFIDAEQDSAHSDDDDWKTQYLTLVGYYTICAAVFPDCPSVIWNYCDASPVIPCMNATWGYSLDRGVINGVSNLDTYLCRCPPGFTFAEHTTRPEAMWKAFLTTVNAMRSCVRRGGGASVRVHLPACHLDQEVSRHYTREIIMHARALGITRFYWAAYMSDPTDRPAMADTISRAMMRGDELFGSQTRLRPLAVSSTAAAVTTGKYRTKRS